MDSYNDNLILCINAIIWLVALIIYIRRRGLWTLGMCILSLYTLISIVSIDLYNSVYASNYFTNNITLFPFIYLFVMMFLIMYPILQLKQNQINTIILPNKKIIDIITFFIVVLSIYKLILIIPNVREGATLILLDSSNTIGLYTESTTARMNRAVAIGNFDYLGILTNLSLTITPLIFYIYLLLPDKNKILFLGVIISLFVSPLNGIANGSRIMMVTGLFETIILFSFFHKFISPKVKRTVITIGAILFSTILFFFIMISTGKAHGSSIEYRIFGYERYFAEGPLVFNNYCMEANGTREGSITFPIIKYMIDGNLLSESDLRFKYSYMKIDNSRFSTYVGDFVLDFGPFIAFVIFVLFAVFLTSNLRIRNNILTASQLILLYFSVRFALGFFQYQYSATSGNVVFFALLLSYWFISWYIKKDKYKIYIKKNI